MKSKLIVLTLALGMMFGTGCGMLMSESDRFDASQQKAFLEDVLAATVDPTEQVELMAAIADIDKKLAEGDMGWGIIGSLGDQSTLLGGLAGLIPGLGVAAGVLRRNRRNITGVFDFVEKVMGEDDKFDKTKAKALMAQSPKLQAQFDAWRAARAATDVIA